VTPTSEKKKRNLIPVKTIISKNSTNLIAISLLIINDKYVVIHVKNLFLGNVIGHINNLWTQIHHDLHMILTIRYK